MQVYLNLADEKHFKFACQVWNKFCSRENLISGAIVILKSMKFPFLPPLFLLIYFSFHICTGEGTRSHVLEQKPSPESPQEPDQLGCGFHLFKNLLLVLRRVEKGSLAKPQQNTTREKKV